MRIAYVSAGAADMYCGSCLHDNTLVAALNLHVLKAYQVQRLTAFLHPAANPLGAGYNAAQRLYVLRGYIPDGRGVTYRDQYVGQYVQVMLDDDLGLHLTKQLRIERPVGVLDVPC